MDRPVDGLTGRAGAHARRAGAALLVVLATAAATWLWFVGGLLWWANAPRVVGWHPYVVLSGSMDPALAAGDVVLVAPVADPSALPGGRIALVADPARPSGSYVHRVVGHRDGDLITRGDANVSADGTPVAPRQVRGEVRLVVPAIGLMSLWVHEGRYGPVALAACGTGLALVLATRRRPSVAP